jgi:hypothetical protein
MNAYSLHSRSTVIVSVSSDARSRSERRMRSTSSSVLSLVLTSKSAGCIGRTSPPASSGPKIAAVTVPNALAMSFWFSGRGRCLPCSQFFHMRSRLRSAGNAPSWAACMRSASMVRCWVQPRAWRSAARRCAHAGRVSSGIGVRPPSGEGDTRGMRVRPRSGTYTLRVSSELLSACSKRLSELSGGRPPWPGRASFHSMIRAGVHTWVRPIVRSGAGICCRLR